MFEIIRDSSGQGQLRHGKKDNRLQTNKVGGRDAKQNGMCS